MDKLLGPVCLLAGLAGIAYAVTTLATAARHARSWVRTIGTVVDSRNDSQADEVILRLLVRFEGPHGPVTFWNRYGSNSGGHRGTQVAIRYNPHDVTDAVIAAGAHGGVSNGLFILAVSAVFAAVGAAVTWFALA
ncbi:DUF3592 domain-containing protein [Amorphoplanes digitatis]|uniref:DUF3592 domain-containing protein n=1 Tax=Actinoplanes digitatis TaxID=1868 RepID=A0A7W7I494_9ACTN|nr:DUF3592 domain-containing protein [Actinoplanes digitatis]MBB4766127.1 hypothetical protein [Actinoplanes digitatis]BFE76130.1 hypothetical protein GCM10020092_094310 [Actinoplanes digitatis]GID96552.1 hypothetical protein Adi01nite_59640 [Actinoplanes digitatis]